MRPCRWGLEFSLALVVICGLTVQFAHAASICSRSTHTKYGETRARFGPTLGSVRQDGSMHAVIYHLDKDAPLGWSHSLRIWKKSREADWRLQLVAVSPMANTNQPFVLEIDGGAKITFDKPHIKNPQSKNEYELTSQTGELGQAIDELKAGNRLKWNYTDESGGKASIAFSLSGLTAALRWLDCAPMSKQLGNNRKSANDAPAFVGTWGTSLAQCRVPQEQQGAPNFAIHARGLGLALERYFGHSVMGSPALVAAKVRTSNLSCSAIAATTSSGPWGSGRR
jgi:hypothetical protein